jgi:bacterioferritin
MLSEKVLKILHTLRDEEATAALQYMNHHAVLKNLNMEFIADFMEKAAVEEMKHAEKITDLMLDMDIDPKGYKIGPKPNWSLNPTEMLKADFQLEVEAIKTYNSAIAICITEKDHITRQLLDKILLEEEVHRLQFEKFLEIVEKVGDMKGAMIGLMQALGK